MPSYPYKLPPYTTARWRGGRWVFHFQVPKRLRPPQWKSGAKRLPDSPDDAFAKARELYRQLEAQRKCITADVAAEKIEGSIDWLCVSFERSDKFRKKKPVTQKDYRKRMGIFRAWAHEAAKVAGVPALHATSLTRPALLAWYESMNATPSQRNHTAAIVRLVLQHGVNKGVILVNPALRPGLEATAPREQVLEEKQVNALAREALILGRRSLALAVYLGFFTGQRETDIISKLGRMQRHQNVLHVKQSKRGAWISCPLSPDLRDMLDMTAEVPGCPTYVVNEETGRPYEMHNFIHWIRRLCKSAGITGYRFSDLRRSAVIQLQRAECSVAEIRGITGQSYKTVVRLLETYGPMDLEVSENANQKREKYREKANQKNASGREFDTPLDNGLTDGQNPNPVEQR